MSKTKGAPLDARVVLSNALAMHITLFERKWGEHIESLALIRASNKTRTLVCVDFKLEERKR